MSFAEKGTNTGEYEQARLEANAENANAKKRRTGDTNYNDTTYYIENGLRKVYPYYYSFEMFTKSKWRDERILDVLVREIDKTSAEEHERAIQIGTITVNGEKITTDYKLRLNDLIATVVHRHEKPVIYQEINIVYMDEEIVVVDKPPSIPVYPIGKFRYNSMKFILAKEYGLKNLKPINILNQLTSGLLMFSRLPNKGGDMERQLRTLVYSREFVCRVEGEFPDEVECKEPIEILNRNIGICKVSPRGEQCITLFQKLGFDGKTSVVLCKLNENRMHQIRVHLQYLGYPIVNDPLYNNNVFGPLKGKGGDLGGKTDAQLVKDIINIHNEDILLDTFTSAVSTFTTISTKGDLEKTWGGIIPTGRIDDDASSLCTEVGSRRSSFSECESKVTLAIQTNHETPDFTFKPDKLTVDVQCKDCCKVSVPDPDAEHLIMFLHAWRFKGVSWEFETHLPSWAAVD